MPPGRQIFFTPRTFDAVLSFRTGRSARAAVDVRDYKERDDMVRRAMLARMCPREDARNSGPNDSGSARALLPASPYSVGQSASAPRPPAPTLRMGLSWKLPAPCCPLCPTQ